MELPKSVKPAVIAAVTNALVAMPSMAGEPGKIFDFNLTLPIIATEFLLLMVILDKTIFGPVGKALDDRDALIRDQLAAVGDNSTAVADLIVRTRNAQRDPLPNPSASSEGERTCPRPARVSGAGDRAIGEPYRTLGSRMARVNPRSGVVSARCRRIATASESSFSRFGFFFSRTRLTEAFSSPPCSTRTTVREGGPDLLRARRGCQGGGRHQGEDGRRHRRRLRQGEG